MSTKKNETTPTYLGVPDPVAEAKAILAEAAAMKAEAEAMKAEVEAEKAILAEAAAPAPVDDGEELVEIRLFKDNGAYKDDLTVGVNGEIIKIQRGKTVKIKKKFYEVIQHSLNQTEFLTDLIANETGRYEAEAKARGIE